ncbi:MAG: formate dehydrogenase subunit alpha [Chromatiales bacterium]
MVAIPAEIKAARTISFKLDGRNIDALPEETILQAAKRLGIEIPYLCYKDGYRPDGNCRACVVEIKGERVLAPSCCRKPTEDMEVLSTNARARRSQKMVLELLLADMPKQGKSPYSPNSELDQWARRLGVGSPRFPGRHQPAADLTNPAIAVNLDACIQCTRCVRACREEQVNDVIGYAFRGRHSKIVFDLDDPMGDSTCVTCGECVQACPTGALMPAKNVALAKIDKHVNSTCPYCGVGCLLTFHVGGDRIMYVDGRDGPANHGRLCVKGRYGFDYVHNSGRLTRPLIRRPGMDKTAAVIPPSETMKYFREATWEEALEAAAGRLRDIRDQFGSGALAGFGSAKGSNEEAYLFQKLVRTGFGTNNVDHCTRLCHASSVAALLECIGSGAVSNQVADGTADADVIFIIGARPTINHPVAATFMKNAARAGKKLIVVGPQIPEIARYAAYMLQIRPGSDVALLNAMMNVIVTEGLQNDEYIARHTEGFEALRKRVLQYTPEKMSAICGIPAHIIREVTRLYATAGNSIIFWGMGISQHVHGTDNARCLIALALMTGQIGRPGTGLHPLRGQNNVQGASDVGLIPMVYPDYQPVRVAAARLKFEELWGANLDPNPGLTVVEIVHAIHDGKIKGMYIMGENPAMSDPNLNHAREALARLKHLVVQDIFFTETAGYADVILPASAFPEKTGTFTNTDRRVQLGRRAIDPPGDAHQDLWIIQEIARRIGLEWNYDGPEAVWDEIRVAAPSMAGITWERLENEDSVTYPCLKEGDPGEPIIFKDGFPTDDGKARFVPVDYTTAAELPDRDYPFVFITGRLLEHWHTGSMTRNASVLDAIEPVPTVQLNPADAGNLGVGAGQPVTVESRRGRVTAPVRLSGDVQRGTVFMAFAFNEAAANLLTTEALDPYGKIPEFKYCAVRVTRAAA